MNDSKQKLCFGRFLVDVPKDAYKVADTATYRSRSISTEKSGREAFQKMLSDKERYLKSTKHEKEPSLLRQLVKADGGETATFVFRESPIDAHQFKVQAFKWIGGRQFIFDSRVDDDRVNKALEISARTLSELQISQDSAIPNSPGFCIDGGFFAGEPQFPHHEERYIVFGIKGKPDIRIRISTDMNVDKINEGLLARIDRKPTPAIYAEAEKRVKLLRRGKHPVGDIEAEEFLETLPTEEAFSIHDFRWESQGKPRNLYAPAIVVSLSTGNSAGGGDVMPSLSDKEAIGMFDAIVNSLRVRPIGGAPAQPQSTSSGSR